MKPEVSGGRQMTFRKVAFRSAKVRTFAERKATLIHLPYRIVTGQSGLGNKRSV